LGGNSRAGKLPADNKTKSSLTINRGTDPSYTLVTACKSSTDSLILTFSGLAEFQHIINNPPILNTSNSVSNYNKSLSTTTISYHDH